MIKGITNQASRTRPHNNGNVKFASHLKLANPHVSQVGGLPADIEYVASTQKGVLADV
jgi:hypothetical protein